jgi:hypothetical protein
MDSLIRPKTDGTASLIVPLANVQERHRILDASKGAEEGGIIALTGRNNPRSPKD